MSIPPAQLTQRQLQRQAQLPKPYEGLLRKNKAAWAFFQAQAPSYRKAVAWWVVSAKQEATRDKRLGTLIQDSAAGRFIKPYTYGRASNARPSEE